MVRRLTRGKPSAVTLASDDEVEDAQGQIPDSDDEISVMKSARKRSAPSSRSPKSRAGSEGEEDDEELPVAKRMFMVSVESLSIPPQ